MQHFAPPKGLRLVSTKTPQRDRTQRDERQKDRQTGVGVDSFKHDANVSDQFHPVGTPKLGRDDAGVGAVNTFTHPASELCQHDSSRDPRIPLAVPSPHFCADARQVVENPEQYADRPLLRRLAWMTLMTERGNVVDQDRLARMPVEFI